MNLILKIENVQHVRSAELTLDLDANGITCLVGRNGIGKTTLVKALRNLRIADTFKKTAVDSIFSTSSKIIYSCDPYEYVFTFDPKLQSLNCKTVVAQQLRDSLEVELPMPYGDRFNFFQSISDADHEIRRNIVIESYTRPDELIDFLHTIYDNNKFDNLRCIVIKKKSYYCQILDESRYIREDYFSSGEYFLISLYRNIVAGRKLIVIDEIDISLDAAAQTKLVAQLRVYCQKYAVNIVFTTHSLAMMETLQAEELHYIESKDGVLDIQPVSFNYAKSLLFGFAGWDKYILTEDDVLENFIEFVIKRYLLRTFYKYKIIFIGGGTNTVRLMDRNSDQNFFSTEGNVISVLDGDQRALRYARDRHNIEFLPWESIEKQIFIEYTDGNHWPRLSIEENPGIDNQNGKNLYAALIRNRIVSEDEMFLHLCETYDEQARAFAHSLSGFLNT
ncbi:ABC-type dipeptide/oligopeptide/nickel transport system ATPase subunit [Paraburkholderia sp. Clong3]|uniref:AAA family ATPase n=1 Tax=Paraburkholderia sp. Clong3 TaxID=2991061 RepID=UPI003D1A2E55